MKSSSAAAAGSGVAVNNAGNDNVINIIQQLSTLPSILNQLLEGIISVYEPQFNDSDEHLASPETEVKISYNSVKIHAEEIREHSGYMSLIDQVIDNIDDENPSAKKTFLWAINQKYKSCRKTLFIENGVDPEDKEHVREIIGIHADRIIESVAKEITASATGSLNFSVELIQAAQELVVCYGFINCRILEKPA